MDSGKAVTDDLRIDARIASFYPLSDEVHDEILKEVLDVLTKIGNKHNFIIWRIGSKMMGDL